MALGYVDTHLLTETDITWQRWNTLADDMDAIHTWSIYMADYIEMQTNVDINVNNKLAIISA